MRSVGEIMGGAADSYKSQLASAEWRAFAQRVRESRRCCECCRRSGVILQVHHLFYDLDRKLWEYNGDELVVLCKTCHDDMHVQLKNFRKMVFRHLTPRLFQIVNGALLVGLTHYDPITFAHALAGFVANEQLVRNHAKAWRDDTSNPK